MTSHTQLVPIRIAEIRAVVMRVVLGPQAGRAVAGAAVGQRQGVNPIHLGARLRQERDHLAIARVVRRLVVWAANEEQGPRAGRRLPARPRAVFFQEPKPHAQRLQHGRVKRHGAFEIAHADHDV